MVYCEQDMCESKLGRLMQAFRADRPSEWLMDDFIGMAEQMHKEIELLRQAEKDAARYRELRDTESETCLEFINAKARAASPEWLDGLVDEYMKCSN